MDKIFNNLSEITNRAKKVNGGGDKVVRKRVVKESPPRDEDYVPVEHDIVEKSSNRKTTPFSESSAIAKALNKPKTKTSTKTTTSKTTAKKSTSKKTTTKPTTKKSTQKSVVKPADIDYSDPKKAQLYEALKHSLFSEGTDLSEYLEGEDKEKVLAEKQKSKELNDTAKRLKETQIISKEQQEYEQLFNAGFSYGNQAPVQEDTQEQEDALPEIPREAFEKLNEKQPQEKDNQTLDEQSKEDKKIEPSKHINSLKSLLDSKKSIRKEEKKEDMPELRERNAEIDRKIADYYRRKQEMIDKYNKQEALDELEENKVEETDSRQQDYESIFTGEMISRNELLGIKEDVKEQTSNDVNNNTQDEQKEESQDDLSQATTISEEIQENEIEDNINDIKEDVQEEQNSEMELREEEQIEESENNVENLDESNQDETEEDTYDEEDQQVNTKVEKDYRYLGLPVNSEYEAISDEFDSLIRNNKRTVNEVNNDFSLENKNDNVVEFDGNIEKVEDNNQESLNNDEILDAEKSEETHSAQDSASVFAESLDIQNYAEVDEATNQQLDNDEIIEEKPEDVQENIVLDEEPLTEEVAEINDEENILTQENAEEKLAVEENQTESIDEINEILTTSANEDEQTQEEVLIDNNNEELKTNTLDEVSTTNEPEQEFEENNSVLQSPEILDVTSEDIEEDDREIQDVQTEYVSDELEEGEEDIELESSEEINDEELNSEESTYEGEYIEEIVGIQENEQTSKIEESQNYNNETEEDLNENDELQNQIDSQIENVIEENNTNEENVNPEESILDQDIESNQIEQEQVAKEELQESIISNKEELQDNQAKEEVQIQNHSDLIQPTTDESEVVSNETYEINSIPTELYSGEYEEEGTMVIDGDKLVSELSLFPEENKEEQQSETIEEVEEEKDVISKEEFYNEMARLQENLINELKGNKVETNSIDYFADANDNISKENIDNFDEYIIDDNLEDKSKETFIVQRDENNEVQFKKFTEEDKKLIDKLREEEIYKKKLEAEKEKINALIDKIEIKLMKQLEKDEREEFVENALQSLPEETLLDSKTPLNEEDLKYVEEENKEPVKDDYFYLSDQDSEIKQEVRDEFLEMYNEETTGIHKEVGDINLNKDIQKNTVYNFIKEIDDKPVLEKSKKEEEIETIYTLFGMERKKVIKEKDDMKILYVASECLPFIATGGLADVASGLSKEIAKVDGVDFRVIMPLYGTIKNEYRDKFEYLGNFTVHLSWRQEYCGLFRYQLDGATYYFIDNERYFKRDKLYGYYDDGERFAYFSKAVVECLPYINFFPDVIHCNDWQTSLVSTYIKTGNWSDFRYYKIKNIYTIHNVEYQGVYGMENLKDLFGVDPRFRNHMEYNGDINLTKAAIQFCDRFTTVSESYCDNLKQPYCSRGLHHIIIRNDYKLRGILNGLDQVFYNPATDPLMYKNYGVDSIEDKVMNKKIWQDELGLPVDGDTPMIAIVSRLVSHKGLDLIVKIMEKILQKDVQLVVVGTGDERFVNYFNYLQDKYPTKVRAMTDKYSNELARKAYAASDIFLMPSKIEPCGLSQMIASRYGSVPIVREVGGLKDTITDFGCEGGGNGYTFTNYNPNDLEYQIDVLKRYGIIDKKTEKIK